MDETVSGVKAALAIKVFGDDFATLDALGQQVLRSVSGVRGAADAQMLVTSGVAELDVRVDRPALARYGLNVTDVEEAVSAGGSGDVISTVIDGQMRCTVALLLPDRYRADPDAMRAIPLKAPGGEQVTLDQVARIQVTRGSEKIEREEGQRRIVVMSNVRGRDLRSFVDEVRSGINKDVKLPPGYFVEYGGQFENQERATRRLMVVVPVVIAVIFVLLHLTFGAITPALLVIGNVPFAVVGGIAALWIRSMNLNLSASVGFIALFGVAMLNGVVLISSIAQLRAAGESTREAVLAGARRRLRPVLMTPCVASFGFIPMAVATSTGAEVATAARLGGDRRSLQFNGPSTTYTQLQRVLLSHSHMPCFVCVDSDAEHSQASGRTMTSCGSFDETPSRRSALAAEKGATLRACFFTSSRTLSTG